MPAGRDLTGQRFGRLTVLELAENRGVNRYWKVKCDCGWRLEVRAQSLTDGRTESCGCKRRDTTRARMRKHGHANPRSPTYMTWRAMINRCENTKHERWAQYGGRGIKVCEDWRGSFETFLADMGERPEGKTIGRIDHDGHYTKANCRWETDEEQRASHHTTSTEEE